MTLDLLRAITMDHIEQRCVAVSFASYECCTILQHIRGKRTSDRDQKVHYPTGSPY